MQLCEVQRPPRPLLKQRITPLPHLVAAQADLLGPTAERMADVIDAPCAVAAQSVLRHLSGMGFSSDEGGQFWGQHQRRGQQD